MRHTLKFQKGDIVASTKFLYLVRNRGLIPDNAGLSKDSDGIPGYEVFNLTTKARYWVPYRLAEEKYTLKSRSTAGQVLFG